MKKIFIVLVFAINVFAVSNARSNYLPDNTIEYSDSVYVDTTETVYTKAFWTDNGAYKTLLIEAWNDSIDGFATDTSAVDIYIEQVWPIKDYQTSTNKGAAQYFLKLPSRAHPDSTTIYSNGSSSYLLFDSLAIASMDTVGVWSRDSLAVTTIDGDTVGYNFDDGINTMQTSGFGAFAYKDIVVSPSPAIMFKVKGTIKNSGSWWRFRLSQISGIPTKNK